MVITSKDQSLSPL